MDIRRIGLLASVLPWLVAASQLHEASTNFDLENVRPFLNRVAKLFDSGFSDTVVSDMARFAAETPVEKERKKSISVTYHGKKVQLVFRVFMDDINAPDIYFFTADASLAEALQAEMIAFSEELGQ